MMEIKRVANTMMLPFGSSLLYYSVVVLEYENTATAAEIGWRILHYQHFPFVVVCPFRLEICFALHGVTCLRFCANGTGCRAIRASSVARLMNK